MLPCYASSTPRWWKQGYGSPPDYHSPKDYQSPRYFKAAEEDKPEALSIGSNRSRPWCADAKRRPTERHCYRPYCD